MVYFNYFIQLFSFIMFNVDYIIPIRLITFSLCICMFYRAISIIIWLIMQLVFFSSYLIVISDENQAAMQHAFNYAPFQCVYWYNSFIFILIYLFKVFYWTWRYFGNKILLRHIIYPIPRGGDREKKMDQFHVIVIILLLSMKKMNIPQLLY